VVLPPEISSVIVKGKLLETPIYYTTGYKGRKLYHVIVLLMGIILIPVVELVLGFGVGIVVRVVVVVVLGVGVGIVVTVVVVILLLIVVILVVLKVGVGILLTVVVVVL